MTASVRIWLIICSLLIVIMVWIGGYTRLTNSGLSITEWRPITGVLPPLSEDAWELEKKKYEDTPEYHKINFNITLSEFKHIYLIEYFHRLFGRIIGIVFLFPFIYFLIRRQLTKNIISATLLAFALGCLQAFIGWYMVKSGLIDQPQVSQYRLALHLLIAAFIFIVLWSQATYHEIKIQVPRNAILLLSLIMTLVILQIFIGGLVAGLKAGLVYNTFPLMDGEIIPKGLLSMSPWWKNFFENITMVQFMHRTLGVIIFLLGSLLYKIHSNMLHGAILLAIISQVLLGIFTLLYVVPLSLASLHQITAFLVLATIIFAQRKTSQIQ